MPLLICLAAAAHIQAEESPNLFRMPEVFGRHQQLAQEFRRQLVAKDFNGMEQTCRAGIELMPEDPTWNYNLACVMARLGRQGEALDQLEAAIGFGFHNENTIASDGDLATLRRLRRFRQLLDKASTLRREASASPTVEPYLVDKQAVVSTNNTVWDLNIGRFQSLFSFAPPAEGSDEPPTNRYVRTPGQAGDIVRMWQMSGMAAGNHGDLYDNRDRGHSVLDLGQFPEMRPVVYSAAAQEAGVDTSFSLFNFLGVPVIGNSSMAISKGPMWRSSARAIYGEGRSMLLLSLQYLSNQIYVYPQHRDYLPEVHGDVFPALTPYLVIAPGASYSDQPILEALALSLAAFRPEVKEQLRKTGMLAPTLQMLLRASQNGLVKRQDYLKPAAHPTVFDGANIDLIGMLATAHQMRTNSLPPMALLRIVHETPAVPGVDFFDFPAGERLFDTPAAIARVVRRMDYTYRIVVDGGSSRELHQRGLTAHWVLMQGDPEKVRITPRLGEPMVAEIEVDYHGGGFAVPTSARRSSRVDIALIVDNGDYYSAPAYISFYYLGNETRLYDDDNRIQMVDYTAAGKGYTDPALSAMRDWADHYRYDAEGQLRGWTRRRRDKDEEYTMDGARVLTRDRLGRPATACRVNYELRHSGDEEGGMLRELIEIDSPQILNYTYASDDDLIGEGR